ncbi:ABC transporter permease subunit [Bradyrhizobium sp. 17]|uniref:ABC transporter permease subunit n=1 Tax=Bradyrhizobium sp. 17 TaxID=2782649 RepID=UPI001FFB3F83|nr:ABC transporter permease subunit [Bradyrhizobium sp. 17]MCK1518799.1 ABC transporter permease subunit [Bradyrhizobium sp. 17]
MKTFPHFRWTAVCLALPALAILFVVFGIPIALLFLTSLNAPAFSIANYQAFLGQPANVRVLFQTIEMSVVATSLCLLFGYPTAYVIAASPKRLRAALLVFVVIPYLTSLLVRTYAWIVILGDRGLINNALLKFGLISNPLPLLYSRSAVYIGMVHIMLPMMILPLVGVMVGIDRSLVAAARSMGAGPLAAFWRVFFPLTLPGLRSGTLLVFILCLGFYITPAALGGLRDAMLSTFIAAQVASSFNLANIAASSFVLLGVAAIVLSLFGLDLSGMQNSAERPTRARPNWLSSSAALKRYFIELARPLQAKRWTTHLYQPGGVDSRWNVAGALFIASVVFYLLAPSVVVTIMSLSSGAFLEFPPSGLSLQWYRSFFGDPSWTEAAWTSIQIGVAVTLVSTFTGTMAAFGLSRTSARLRGFLTMIILMPITFPSIVVAIATYLGLLNVGLIGSRTGIVLAHSAGAIGYVVVIVAATLANFDRRLEQASMSMRAGPFQTARRVTLPIIMPGIIGGAIFAFIHSFDEVVISSLVSGFSIRTLPLKMWENIRHAIDPTIAAVASMLVLLPVLWLFTIYLTWWRSRPEGQRTFGSVPT